VCHFFASNLANRLLIESMEVLKLSTLLAAVAIVLVLPATALVRAATSALNVVLDFTSISMASKPVFNAKILPIPTLQWVSLGNPDWSSQP